MKEDEPRRSEEVELNQAGEEQAFESKKRARAKTKVQEGSSRVHMLSYVAVKRRSEERGAPYGKADACAAAGSDGI